MEPDGADGVKNVMRARISGNYIRKRKVTVCSVFL